VAALLLQLAPAPKPHLPPHRGPVARARLSVPPRLHFGMEFPDDNDDEDEDEDEDEDAALSTTEFDIEISKTPADNMTVAELQKQLKRVGSKSSGTKKELIERVQMMQRRDALGLPVHDLQVQNEEEFKWYMLQTANGFERGVERTINMATVAQRLTKKIDRVFVPILEGETSVRENSVMPSYIFIRMRMDAKLHFFISNMQYVISFVGFDRGGRSATGQMVGNRGFVRPKPITDEEFEKIVALTRAKTKAEDDEEDDEADASRIAIDDVVEVFEGPFKGMQGPVLERGPLEGEPEEQALTLVLTVMGRDTPVTVPERHCAKVAEVV